MSAATTTTTIEKGFIFYRKTLSPKDREDRMRALKYGLYLSSFYNADFSEIERRLCKRRIYLQGRKKAPATEASYYYANKEHRMVQAIEKISGIKKFKLNFQIGFDFDVFHSEYSIDSQFTVQTEGESESESENELDREIQSGSKILQRNKRNLRKIFKQAKKVNDLSLRFWKMNQAYEQGLRYLSLLNLLEYCCIKIRIWNSSDILALRDLLKQAKRRNYWPDIKSMVIKLRHSYNQENCSSRFIRFCHILQEINEIAQDLPWIKIELKVKYLWRLDESAILALKETLEKAHKKFLKLSFVTRQVKEIELLRKTIEEMNSLQGFSLLVSQPCDSESGNYLEKLATSLKKIQSLRKLKVRGKNLLDKEQNEEPSTKEFITHLGDLSQITSLNFQETDKDIDETLWSCFSNSVSKLSQLQVLSLKVRSYHYEATTFSPDLNGFLDFFVGLKNLHNLRTFAFNMHRNSSKTSRIEGSQIFQAACEALQNQKELRNLNFRYPWLSNLNLDIQQLAKLLPNLQKLEDFSFDFVYQDYIEPVENDTLMKFAKAISSLKTIRSFKIDLDMKEINSLTYEAALIISRHSQATKNSCCVHMLTNHADEETIQRFHLLKGVTVYKRPQNS